MIGEKCESCGDEVLILKSLSGKRLCLDCYCKFKEDNKINSESSSEDILENFDNESKDINQNRFYGDRRCPDCGRIIPFDSSICPYCCKKFKSYL